MENVFQKAEELGKAILESKTYAQMSLAEQRAMEDETVLKAVDARNEARQKVEELLQQPDVDKEALEKASQHLKVAEDEMQGIEPLQDLNEKRQAFSYMMNEVNQIIQFALTGEKAQQGCGGNCSGCSGC